MPMYFAIAAAVAGATSVNWIPIPGLNASSPPDPKLSYSSRTAFAERTHRTWPSRDSGLLDVGRRSSMRIAAADRQHVLGAHEETALGDARFSRADGCTAAARTSAGRRRWPIRRAS